jgi:hypothetical protein
VLSSHLKKGKKSGKKGATSFDWASHSFLGVQQLLISDNKRPPQTTGRVASLNERTEGGHPWKNIKTRNEKKSRSVRNADIAGWWWCLGFFFFLG